MTDEKKIYDFWKKAGLFKSDTKSSKKTFSLLIPPPNLTGELHIGHAMQHSILDAVARFRRLRGFDVLLLPGVDHAGIAFENTFDKELKKQNLSKEKLGREKWLETAWQFKEKIYKTVSASWRIMGLSADWSKEVFSLDEKRKKAVFHQFKKYYDDGLIYKGPYIVQWCPKCQTAIEDLEMEYEERKEKLYFVKYQIREKSSEHITVATTRPETIFADVAVAIHPNHPSYSKFIGLHATNPFSDYLPAGGENFYKKVLPNGIKIIEDQRVEKDFGTGALKITPGHDSLDYQIGKDHDLPLINVIDKSGKMYPFLGNELSGLKVEDARKKAVEILQKLGAIQKIEDYVHNVAVCERCKTIVEPLISEEWFLKVDQIAKGAIEIINADKIKFLPKNYKKILIDWLSDIHDWCISRSLWWGHRIPVWYPSTRSARSGQVTEIKISLESPGQGWVQDEQVLDTWFSSGLWPISTLGWPFDSAQGKPSNEKPDLDPKLEKYFPWDFEISAPEIKYLWIARMIMISNYITGKEPFKTMFFHGMLRDLEGRKFSKSLGNGIEPQYLIDKWGTDATRMALYTYSIPGRDGRVSREILDERGKNFRNFATKMRNISRFILELKPEKSKSKPEFKHKDDKWIKADLDKTIAAVTKNLEETQLHLASEEIYEFIWHSFADIYLEKSKARREDSQPVLEYVLKNCLVALHPFMPFLTEELYQKFEDKKKSIMLEKWPSSNNSRRIPALLR